MHWRVLHNRVAEAHAQLHVEKGCNGMTGARLGHVLSSSRAKQRMEVEAQLTGLCTQTTSTNREHNLGLLPRSALEGAPIAAKSPANVTGPAAVFMGVHVSPGLAPCNLSLGHDATVSPPRSSAHPKNSRCNRLPRSARRLPDNQNSCTHTSHPKDNLASISLAHGPSSSVIRLAT